MDPTVQQLLSSLTTTACVGAGEADKPGGQPCTITQVGRRRCYVQQQRRDVAASSESMRVQRRLLRQWRSQRERVRRQLRRSTWSLLYCTMLILCFIFAALSIADVTRQPCAMSSTSVADNSTTATLASITMTGTTSRATITQKNVAPSYRYHILLSCTAMTAIMLRKAAH